MIVPSGGPTLSRERRMRLIAVLPVRDGMRWLPGFVRNVAPHVDGIVALDDGSSDGSDEFLDGCDSVLELLRVPSERPEWDDVANHRSLVAAARRHDADWIVSLDADERVEREFRERSERAVRYGRVLGCSAFALRLRELWDEPHQYRADGRWGRKAVARLFRSRADHEFDARRYHGHKAPLQARRRGRYPIADLNVYHLGMLSREDREARRRRWELLDPDRRWQSLGYEYLTDERGLELRPVPDDRGYVD